MDEAERFRSHAARCRTSAQGAIDEKERLRLLNMARAWDAFAGQSARKKLTAPSLAT